MIFAANDPNFKMILITIFAVMGLIMLAVFLWFMSFFRIWLKCLMAGANVTLIHIVGMKLRKSPVAKLCDVKIMATQAGMDVKLSDIERGHIAGADVELVVRAMIKAQQLDQELTWEDALKGALKNQYDDYVEENYDE